MQEILGLTPTQGAKLFCLIRMFKEKFIYFQSVRLFSQDESHYLDPASDIEDYSLFCDENDRKEKKFITSPVDIKIHYKVDFKGCNFR